MAELSESQKRRLEEKKLKENQKILEDEAESREKRIKMRQEQRLRAEARLRIRRRKRVFKVAGAWIAAIFVALYAATWFSADFADWLHSLIHGN